MVGELATPEDEQRDDGLDLVEALVRACDLYGVAEPHYGGRDVLDDETAAVLMRAKRRLAEVGRLKYASLDVSDRRLR